AFLKNFVPLAVLDFQHYRFVGDCRVRWAVERERSKVNRLAGLIERLVSREQDSIAASELNRLIGSDGTKSRVGGHAQLTRPEVICRQRECYLRGAEPVSAPGEQGSRGITVHQIELHASVSKRVSRSRVGGDDSH